MSTIKTYTNCISDTQTNTWLNAMINMMSVQSICPSEMVSIYRMRSELAQWVETTMSDFVIPFDATVNGKIITFGDAKHQIKYAPDGTIEFSVPGIETVTLHGKEYTPTILDDAIDAEKERIRNCCLASAVAEGKRRYDAIWNNTELCTMGSGPKKYIIGDYIRDMFTTDGKSKSHCNKLIPVRTSINKCLLMLPKLQKNFEFCDKFVAKFTTDYFGDADKWFDNVDEVSDTIVNFIYDYEHRSDYGKRYLWDPRLDELYLHLRRHGYFEDHTPEHLTDALKEYLDPRKNDKTPALHVPNTHIILESYFKEYTKIADECNDYIDEFQTTISNYCKLITALMWDTDFTKRCMLHDYMKQYTFYNYVSPDEKLLSIRIPSKTFETALFNKASNTNIFNISDLLNKGTTFTVKEISVNPHNLSRIGYHSFNYLPSHYYDSRKNMYCYVDAIVNAVTAKLNDYDFTVEDVHAIMVKHARNMVCNAGKSFSETYVDLNDKFSTMLKVVNKCEKALLKSTSPNFIQWCIKYNMVDESLGNARLEALN